MHRDRGLFCVAVAGPSFGAVRCQSRTPSACSRKQKHRGSQYCLAPGGHERRSKRAWLFAPPALQRWPQPEQGTTHPRRAGLGVRVPGHGWRRRSQWGGSGRRWKPFLLALRRDDRWWMSEGEKQTAGARGRGAYCILNEPVCHGSWHPRHMEPNTAALLDVSK